MSNLPIPAVEIEDSPEVKSYTYQQLHELSPYITPQTEITVMMKDPAKLALQFETDGKDYDAVALSELFRISISLKEGDAKITSEGLDKDVLGAIRQAKEGLIKQLAAIQDDVVT
ncbi:MAG: hypothetical protein EOP06_28750, partial [Proteobacteria bacterium]